MNFKMCVCRYKPPKDHQIKLRTFSALQQALLYPFLIILPNSNHYSDVNQHLLVLACAWPLSICDHEKYTFVLVFFCSLLPVVRFVYIVTCTSHLMRFYLFFALSYCIVWIYHSSFILLTSCSGLGYLNKAVLNIFGSCLLVDVSTPLRNGIAVSLCTCMFSFRKNCQMVFQSGWTNLHFHYSFSPAVTAVTRFSDFLLVILVGV